MHKCKVTLHIYCLCFQLFATFIFMETSQVIWYPHLAKRCWENIDHSILIFSSVQISVPRTLCLRMLNPATHPPITKIYAFSLQCPREAHSLHQNQSHSYFHYMCIPIWQKERSYLYIQKMCFSITSAEIGLYKIVLNIKVKQNIYFAQYLTVFVCCIHSCGCCCCSHWCGWG